MVKTLAGSLFLLSSFCAAQNIITVLDAVSSLGGNTSIAIPSDGLPVVSYYDGINYDLKVVKCGNNSCSSGNTISTVDADGNMGLYTSIAIPSDGLPVVSYYDGTNDDLKVVKCGNASCSSNNTITAVDTAGRVGRYTSIAVSSDGLPVVSYHDYTNGDFKVVKCGNAFCSAGNTITTVDTAGEVGGDNSIAVPADGRPIISYWDNTNDYLKVVKCGNASCSAGNTIRTRYGGVYISMAISSDGLPIFSYHDYTYGELKVVKCRDASCSAGNSRTVDATGDVGGYTSIAVPSDGLPIISYRDNTNRDLKAVKCGDASCLTGNTITTLDTTGNVGLYTSIAVGIDSLPIISYLGNSNLKVVKCGRPDCSEGTTGTLRRGFDPDRLISISQFGGILTIKLDNPGLIQIIDVTGKRLFEFPVSKHGHLEVPDLKQGVYFVHLNSPEGAFVRKVSVLY